jgi:hypothetical protein
MSKSRTLSTAATTAALRPSLTATSKTVSRNSITMLAKSRNRLSGTEMPVVTAQARTLRAMRWRGENFSVRVVRAGMSALEAWRYRQQRHSAAHSDKDGVKVP